MGCREIRVEVTPGACIGAALSLLILPLAWTGGILLASAVHEACHIAAVYLWGGRILAVRIGLRGAKIRASILEPWQEGFCALAGPAGELMLVMLSPIAPRTAVCALVQGLFNLIPVYPLDGGRAVLAFCRGVYSEDLSVKIVRRTGILSVLILELTVIFIFFRLQIRDFALISAAFLTGIHILRKISCKQGQQRLQYTYHI